MSSPAKGATQAGPGQRRRAAAASVCCIRECTHTIKPGQLIVRVPGSGWKHEDCAKPSRVR
jgi:hypothetical protein